MYWQFLEKNIKPFPSWSIQNELVVGEKHFEALNEYEDVQEEDNSIIRQIKALPEYNQDILPSFSLPLKSKKRKKRPALFDDKSESDNEVHHIVL